MKRAKFSRAEKRMLVAVNCLIGLLLGLSWWRQSLSALPVGDIPTPQLPQPNAFDFYVQAGNLAVPRLVPSKLGALLMPATPLPNNMLYKASLAIRENWLHQNRIVLQTLRIGFAYRYLQPPARSWDDKLSHLSKFQELAGLLAIESRTKAERGDWGGASQSALDLIRFGTDIPHGGPIAAMGTGQAIQTMGCEHIWAILPHLNLSETRTALARLERIKAQSVSYAASLQEEKWSMQASLLEAMRKKLLWVALEGNAEPEQIRLRTSFLNNRLIMRHYTELMDAQISNAQRPFTAPQLAVVLPSWSWGDPIIPVIALTHGEERIAALNNQTQNSLLLVALALRAFRLEHGAYPRQLKELVPHYIKKIPVDPFGGGESVCYKPKITRYIIARIEPKATAKTHGFPDAPGSGKPTYRYAQVPYTLYSVGPNGVDDEGKPTVRDDFNGVDFDAWGHYGVSLESRGDVVAGINF